MIRNIHIQQLREIIEQQERDLVGWRRMLALAEQEERVGAILPDPIPRPAATSWTVGEPLTRGAAPYPPATNGVGTPLYDGTLPPTHEHALGTLTSEHDAYAQTPKAVAEDEKWRQA